MKKITSFILCISLLLSIICIPVYATENAVATENVEEFCEDLNEMISEYSDSEFVTPEFVEEEETAESTEEEIEINYCPRLIVQSDEPIDTYNAVDVVSGFSNFYIVQFENEDDTNYAYEQYKNNPDIISVEYDVSYNALSGTTEEATTSKALTYEDYKNAWYLQSTGMDMVLEKYKDQNLPEVVVAVVDTGVDFNCKYLNDRIIPTGFNNSGEDDENSEQDYQSHGTMVSSVIANCTTDNVKIANYRCGTREGMLTSTSACAAMLQAVNDGVCVINCSFTLNSAYDLIEETLAYAYSKDVFVVVAAGNYPNHLDFFVGSPLHASEITTVVSACNIFNVPTAFTAYGSTIDIVAPGQDVPVISLNNVVRVASGTSFSAPIISSVYAMFYSVNKALTFKERVRAVESCGLGIYQDYVKDCFGSGIVSALELFGLDIVEEPVFSYDEGNHIGRISLELFSEDGADIYYTTDQTCPSPTNGILYTEPIEFFDAEMCIRAVAYKNGNRSSYIYKKLYSMVLGTDDMFVVNGDGVITEYKGNVKYLKIPEVINGITVKDISAYSGFDTAELYGVVLPDTVEYIGMTLEKYDRTLTEDEQYGIFNDNSTIEFLVGNGIKVVGYYGVSFAPHLYKVEFPNCEEIMCSGFYESRLVGARFPKVKKVDCEAFSGCALLREIYLPECEEIGAKAFDFGSIAGLNSGVLHIIYAPKVNYMADQECADEIFAVDSSGATERLFANSVRLKEVDLPLIQTIGKNAFFNSALKNVQLSKIEYIYDLPAGIWIHNSGGIEPLYSPCYHPVQIELSLPSTLKYCVPATDYKNEYIEYVVYGTAGINSYAEQWAKDNGIQFINISKETAIVEDIEPVWDKYSYEPLEFDARGFNRTYQWYGSNDAKQGNYDDKAISGATAKTFDPGEDAQYQYYYCKMTSTDKNIKGEVVSTVTVNSSMCHNRFHLMYAKDDTYIDFTNKYIFTLKQGCKDVLDIVGVPSTTDYRYLPSHGVLKEFYYGTSAVFVVYTNGTQQSRYTIVVQGDTNGDSVVDALDVADVEKTVNGNYELYDEFYLAADLDCDEGISITDYQQVVNRALA